MKIKLKVVLKLIKTTFGFYKNMKNNNRNIFFKNLIGCFIFIVFSQSHYLKASHILGAEITYKHVFASKYKFYLTVYRDCNECKFNGNGGGNSNLNCSDISSLTIRGSEGTSYSHLDLASIELGRKEVVDITKTCSTAVSKCGINATVNYGFEKQVFEGDYDFIDLLGQNYCKFDVSIGISSRNIKVNPTTAEQNFYNYTTLSLCNNNSNQSTVFQNSPQFLYPINQSQIVSLGVSNPDNDSLVFFLKPAKVNRLSNVSYSSGRNFNEPFSYYCLNTSSSCVPNVTSLPFQGFYISSLTGDVAFTPIINNQGGVIVVECEEWKKDINGVYFLAGVVRRDIYAETINASNNTPSIVLSNNNLLVCQGESKSIEIQITDLPFNSSVFDNTEIELLGNESNAIIEPLLSQLPGVKRFKLTIVGTALNIGEHRLLIKVKDNHCPIYSESSQTLFLNIKSLPNFVINKNIKNCGDLTLQPQQNSLRNYLWTLKNINGQIIKQSNSRKLNHQLQNGGQYIAEVMVPMTNTSCEKLVIDTFFVEDLTPPQLNMGPDIKVCKNTPFELMPITEVEKPGGQWFVNNTHVNDVPFKGKTNVATQLVFRYKFPNGCYTDDVVKIDIHPSLDYTLSDVNLCLNELKEFNKIHLETQGLSAVKKFELIESEVNVNLNNSILNQWEFGLIENKSSSFKLFSVIEDINSCIYNDTINVEIKDTFKIDLVLPPTICINQLPFTLPQLTNGNWTLLSNNTNLTNKLRLSDIGSNKNILLKLIVENNACYSQKSFELNVLDTVEIDFQGPDKVRLCENFEQFNLIANPANGTWYGTGVDGNVFKLTKENNDIKDNVVFYRYNAANGCVSNKDFSIEVNKLPYLNIYQPQDSVCFGDIIQFQAEIHENYSGYWFTNGYGRFNTPNELFTTYYPSKQDVQLGQTSFLYTIQTNGICGNVSKQVEVFIKDGPVGTIVLDYPQEICEPAKIQFKSNFNDITLQKWYINDSLIETYDYEFPFETTLKAGEYFVKTKVKDGSCSATGISEKIIVLPQPKVDFYSNPNGKMSKEMPRLYVKDLSHCKYGHTISWYYNDSLINNQDREFSFVVNKEISDFKIKLIAESLKGACKDSIIRNYQFVPIYQLFIPDAFTPDSKGPDMNNVFKVFGPTMKKYNIEIFNRFGEKVFYSNDMTQVWDGTYNGKLCIQGVYFYKIVTIDIEGFDRDYSGTVTLLR
jgi:gliding motility-associated-like protein